MTKYELQRHFEYAIMEAFEHEDSIQVVTTALVRALGNGKIRRAEINAAYDREDI